MSHHAWLDQMLFRFAFHLGYRLLQGAQVEASSKVHDSKSQSVGGGRDQVVMPALMMVRQKLRLLSLIYLLLCVCVHD